MTAPFDFVVGDIPRDEVPIDVTSTDLCEKCGLRPKAPYGGRGPRTRLCVECKPGRGTTARMTGKNANLAAQATQALMQLNNFATLGLMMAQLGKTARKWSSEIEEEAFRQSIYDALLLDPELCRWICRGGVKSGKIALLIAYGMLFASVAPTAIAEAKERKAEKEREQGAQEAQEQEDARVIDTKPVWSAA